MRTSGVVHTMLEVDPNDPDRVYAAGPSWMSTNAGLLGSSFERDRPRISARGPCRRPHPGVRSVHPKIVYVGTDGGMTAPPTRRRRCALERRLARHDHHDVLDPDLEPAYPTCSPEGMQDNGTSVTFGNRTWYQPGGGDGTTSARTRGTPTRLLLCGESSTSSSIPAARGRLRPIPPCRQRAGSRGPATSRRAAADHDIAKPHSALAAEPRLRAAKHRQDRDGVDGRPSLRPSRTAAPSSLWPAHRRTIQDVLARVAFRPPAAPGILPCP